MKGEGLTLYFYTFIHLFISNMHVISKFLL